jgi:hypothetical protein
MFVRVTLDKEYSVAYANIFWYPTSKKEP